MCRLLASRASSNTQRWAACMSLRWRNPKYTNSQHTARHTLSLYRDGYMLFFSAEFIVWTMKCMCGSDYIQSCSVYTLHSDVYERDRDLPQTHALSSCQKRSKQQKMMMTIWRRRRGKQISANARARSGSVLFGSSRVRVNVWLRYVRRPVNELFAARRVCTFLIYILDRPARQAGSQASVVYLFFSEQ